MPSKYYLPIKGSLEEKKKKTEEQLTSFGWRPMENINIRIRNILRSEVGY